MFVTCPRCAQSVEAGTLHSCNTVAAPKTRVICSACGGDWGDGHLCGAIATCRIEPIGITHLGDKPKEQPLSFRDQCAIAAMRAIIELQHSTNRDDNEETIDDPQVASMAFDLAEAMEAERTKRNAKG